MVKAHALVGCPWLVSIGTVAATVSCGSDEMPGGGGLITSGSGGAAGTTGTAGVTAVGRGGSVGLRRLRGLDRHRLTPELPCKADALNCGNTGLNACSRNRTAPSSEPAVGHRTAFARRAFVAPTIVTAPVSKPSPCRLRDVRLQIATTGYCFESCVTGNPT